MLRRQYPLRTRHKDRQKLRQQKVGRILERVVVRSTQKLAKSTGIARVLVEWPTDLVACSLERRSRVSSSRRMNRRELTV